MAFKMNSPLPMFGDPGKIGKNKEKEKNTLDAINDVSMQSNKFVPKSKKTTVKKETSKNSRANIKARKEADKAAGVSKSQMRANKAKSKSEAALEKAKKSKNPSYKAQLKRKADRLAKRAERKGGSPVKAVGDPKDPKRKYGKATVKKDKNEYGFNRITVSHPYTTKTNSKKTNKSYKQLAKEGGDVAAAQKFNKNKTSSGVETRTMLYGDAKPAGPKISVSTPKPKIDLSKKPTKPSNITVGTAIQGGKRKPPKIKQEKKYLGTQNLGKRKPGKRSKVTSCN